MDNKDLMNAAAGYAAGNAVARSISNNLQKQIDEMQRKNAQTLTPEVISGEVAKFLLDENISGAYEFLNSHYKEEIIYAAQHQTEYVYSLSKILDMRKEKYLPYYEKISMPMPEKLSTLTAESLCDLLGVENLHYNEENNAKTAEQIEAENDNSGCIISMVVVGIIIFVAILFVVATL